MATVRNRGGILHIQCYDPSDKKHKSMSTGLSATETNLKKATKFAKQFQDKIRKDYKKQKEMGINRISVKDAFNHFLRVNSGKHPKTIKDYNRFYKKFTETFSEELSCTSINKLNVENFLLDIKQLPIAKNSIHSYGKQLNHFLNFLFEYAYCSVFRINREVKTRPEVKQKIIFTDEALTMIVSGLKEKNTNFKTAVNLLLYTGLRSSDILTIQVQEIDLKNRVLRYYSPKRKKYREVGFHKKLTKVFSARMKDVKQGKILDYSNIENLGRAVHRYLVELELDSFKYSARTFRKTFITLCRSRYNIDPAVVMELVGHEPENTTDRYYNKVSIEKMNQELNKFRIPMIKNIKKISPLNVTMAKTVAEPVNLLYSNKLAS